MLTFWWMSIVRSDETKRHFDIIKEFTIPALLTLSTIGSSVSILVNTV